MELPDMLLRLVLRERSSVFVLLVEDPLLGLAVHLIANVGNHSGSFWRVSRAARLASSSNSAFAPGRTVNRPTATSSTSQPTPTDPQEAFHV